MNTTSFDIREIDFKAFKESLKQGRVCDGAYVERLFDKSGAFIPTDEELLALINSFVAETGREEFLENYKGCSFPLLTAKERWNNWWLEKWKTYGGRPFYLCTNYWISLIAAALVISTDLDVIKKTELLFACGFVYMVGRAIYKYGRIKIETGITTSELHVCLALISWVFAHRQEIGNPTSAFLYTTAAGVYTLVRDIIKSKTKQNTILLR